jgi:predicted RNase H-like nuclease (RuvC/YqgF family)
MKREITSLTEKCNDIENSQKFLSNENDSLKSSLQETKKGISEVSTTLKSLNDRVGISDRDLHKTREMTDGPEQYLHSDCIEITDRQRMTRNKLQCKLVKCSQFQYLNTTYQLLTASRQLEK